MSKYSDYVDRLEQNDKKKRIIIFVVVAVLVLIFLVGCIWGLQSVLETEGTYDASAVPPDMPAALEGEQNILSYFGKALDDTAADDVIARVKAETYFEIDAEKISVGDSDADNALEKELGYAKDTILGRIKEYEDYTKTETVFGDDISPLAVPILFDENDAEISLQVGSLNAAGDLENIDRYYFKAVFGEYALDELPEEIFNSLNFSADEFAAVTARLTSDFSDVADIRGSRITCKNFEISGNSYIESDRINSVCYSRLYEIALDVTFKGELAPLGEKTLTFPFCVYEIHDYYYAGIELKTEQLWIKKKASELIEVTKTHGDDEMTVSFTSSDESIATVDAQGYVEGVSYSDKPAIITVKAEYLGMTFIKECEVYVRHAVEGVELEEDVVRMQIGETKTLVPVFEPKAGAFSKAPEFTQVTWYVGEDAEGNSYSDIVSIDENGKLTILGDNEAHYAEVFCVSLDGKFKATCEITIY